MKGSDFSEVPPKEPNKFAMTKQSFLGTQWVEPAPGNRQVLHRLAALGASEANRGDRQSGGFL